MSRSTTAVRSSEDRTIYEMAREGHGPAEIARVLNRSRRTVYQHAVMLGVGFKPHKWTLEEDGKLRECIALALYRWQCCELLERSENAIDGRIARLGLKLQMPRKEFVDGIKLESLYKCDGCDERIPASRFRPEALTRKYQHGVDSRVCIECEKPAVARPPEVFEAPRDSWGEDEPIGATIKPARRSAVNTHSEPDQRNP